MSRKHRYSRRCWWSSFNLKSVFVYSQTSHSFNNSGSSGSKRSSALTGLGLESTVHSVFTITGATWPQQVAQLSCVDCFSLWTRTDVGTLMQKQDQQAFSKVNTARFSLDCSFRLLCFTFLSSLFRCSFFCSVMSEQPLNQPQCFILHKWFHF